MDEVGLSISYSSSPNCQTHPFIYSPSNSPDNLIPYSLLILKQDFNVNDILSRDYFNGITEK
jgi:hypothetical protein